MTDQEVYTTLTEMRNSGGGFVRQLAFTYQAADSDNRAKLLQAFHEIFTRYGLPIEPAEQVATEEEMLEFAKEWGGVGKYDITPNEYDGSCKFITWYYAQPKGACHE